MARDILLAAIIGAQGLKGQVKVKLFTATAEGLARYQTLMDARGNRFEITAIRPSKDGEAVMSLSGIADRNQAEALKGTEL